MSISKEVPQSKVMTVPFVLTSERIHNAAVPLSHLLNTMIGQFSFKAEQCWKFNQPPAV